MKKFIIASIAAVASIAASAQNSEYTIFNNPDNAPYFGARVGVDITSTSGADDLYNNGAGFTIGAVYNIPLWQNLYFEPGLSIFYDTFGMEIQYDPTPMMLNGSIRNFGMRIPLVAGYNFDFTDNLRIAPFTGPQINFNITAKEHWDEINGQETPTGGSIFGVGGFKRIDLQWVIGVGVTYGKYYVSLSGGIGLTKARDIKFDNFRRNTVNISLGYNF